MSKRRRPETFECPNCGAPVRVGRKACRECGSDDLTGWQSSEEIDYQSIDIPEGYGPEDGASGPGSAHSRPTTAWLWPVVLVLTAIAVLILALGRR
ncbi:MAG TPA: hypothetical protein ENI87_04310 [bacterium]|nr:hypothetical protein [bacterium]